MTAATETLARVPLLAGLDKKSLASLAQAMQERTFDAGTQATVEGQVGLGFFIVLEGSATVTIDAILTGREGAPCGCFGKRSRVSRWGIARNLALAAGLFALPWLPDELNTEGWLAFGLAIALAGVAVLSLVTLALAREVGLLRRHLVPQAALELPDEGLPIGAYSSLAHWFPTDRDSLAVALFTSESCALCNALAPELNAFAKSPDVDVLFFNEVNDATAWAEARVPASPYAIALDSRGVVRSKGTFDSIAQLERILAAAEGRAA